jgi:hypothetical protein
MRGSIRRVKESVPIEEAIRRALFYLSARPALHLSKASEVAYAIWPDSTFHGQGAGGAASRVLRRADKAGLTKWTSNGSDWGWKLTPAGRAWLRHPTPLLTDKQKENRAAAEGICDYCAAGIKAPARSRQARVSQLLLPGAERSNGIRQQDILRIVRERMDGFFWRQRGREQKRKEKRMPKVPVESHQENLFP